MGSGEETERDIMSPGLFGRALSLISALLTVFLTLILAANLWLILSRVWLKQPVPSVLGYTPVYVLSGSMEPAFSAGDMILIHAVGQYEPGEVVTFREEGEFITHRIISETKEGFRVQGDANNVMDEEPVAKEAIIGKVVFVLPGVGRLAAFLRSGKGVLILAALVLLAAVLTRRGDRNRKA